MNKLLKAYIFGAIFGIVWEYIVATVGHHLFKTNNHRCVTKFNVNCLLTMTIFNIYGWAALIMTFLLDRTEKFDLSLLMKAILLTLVVVLIECVGGGISNMIYGYHRWEYGASFVPFCDGYCSIVSTIAFFVIIMLFVIYVYPLL